MASNQHADTVPEDLGRALFLFLALGLLAISPNSISAQEAAAPPPQQTRPPAVTRQLSFEERADIFMARKEYADAVDYYNRALKVDPNRQAVIWNKMGIAYQQQEKFDLARKAYKSALKKDKTMAEAWNNLGTTYFLQGRAKKSLKYYERAVKLNPEGASFHMNYGTGLFRRKKYDKAVEEYRMALSINPNILREHSAQGTVVDARAGGQKIHYLLAKTFASLGMSDEAVRYLRRAFEEGFNDRDKLAKDPDFQKISANPAYIELLNNPPVPIKD
jgi:tetratricopeptide (TPR) repeat protein